MAWQPLHSRKLLFPFKCNSSTAFIKRLPDKYLFFPNAPADDFIASSFKRAYSFIGNDNGLRAATHRGSGNATYVRTSVTPSNITNKGTSPFDTT
jgi:hypothetical protein